MTTFNRRDTALPETLEDCHTQLTQLRAAMQSRSVIDQAKGVLIARHGCTADEAFVMLSEASQRANRKLRDLAVAVVESEWRQCSQTNRRSTVPNVGPSDGKRLDLHNQGQYGG